MNSEFENYLGYESNSKVQKATNETEISIPRDRNSDFESMLIPNYQHDVSEIDRKVLVRGIVTFPLDDIYV